MGGDGGDRTHCRKLMGRFLKTFCNRRMSQICRSASGREVTQIALFYVSKLNSIANANASFCKNKSTQFQPQNKTEIVWLSGCAPNDVCYWAVEAYSNLQTLQLDIRVG